MGDGSQVIPGSVCDQCRARGTLGIERRGMEISPSVFELAVVCGRCGRRQHACYVSKTLERLAEKIMSESWPVERARLQRQYVRKFRELQRCMGEVTPSPLAPLPSRERGGVPGSVIIGSE